EAFRLRGSLFSALQIDFLKASQSARFWGRFWRAIVIGLALIAAVTLPAAYTLNVRRQRNELQSAQNKLQDALALSQNVFDRAVHDVSDLARSAIAIQYQGDDPGSKLRERWQSLGFQAVSILMPPMNVPPNSLTYSGEVDLLSIRLVAYTLVEAGVQLRQL